MRVLSLIATYDTNIFKMVLKMMFMSYIGILLLHIPKIGFILSRNAHEKLKNNWFKKTGPRLTFPENCPLTKNQWVPTSAQDYNGIPLATSASVPQVSTFPCSMHFSSEHQTFRPRAAFLRFFATPTLVDALVQPEHKYIALMVKLILDIYLFLP